MNFESLRDIGAGLGRSLSGAGVFLQRTVSNTDRDGGGAGWQTNGSEGGSDSKRSRGLKSWRSAYQSAFTRRIKRKTSFEQRAPWFFTAEAMPEGPPPSTDETLVLPLWLVSVQGIVALPLREEDSAKLDALDDDVKDILVRFVNGLDLFDIELATRESSRGGFRLPGISSGASSSTFPASATAAGRSSRGWTLSSYLSSIVMRPSGAPKPGTGAGAGADSLPGSEMGAATRGDAHAPTAGSIELQNVVIHGSGRTAESSGADESARLADVAQEAQTRSSASDLDAPDATAPLLADTGAGAGDAKGNGHELHHQVASGESTLSASEPVLPASDATRALGSRTPELKRRKGSLTVGKEARRGSGSAARGLDRKAWLLLQQRKSGRSLASTTSPEQGQLVQLILTNVELSVHKLQLSLVREEKEIVGAHALMYHLVLSPTPRPSLTRAPDVLLMRRASIVRSRFLTKTKLSAVAAGAESDGAGGESRGGGLAGAGVGGPSAVSLARSPSLTGAGSSTVSGGASSRVGRVKAATRATLFSIEPSLGMNNPETPVTDLIKVSYKFENVHETSNDKTMFKGGIDSEDDIGSVGDEFDGFFDAQAEEGEFEDPPKTRNWNMYIAAAIALAAAVSLLLVFLL